MPRPAPSLLLAFSALSTLLLAVCILLPPLAAAQSYLPLVVGNRWDYVAANGNHETQRITGTREFFGRTVYVKRYENSTENEGLENYWIEAPDGSVLLCGFQFPDGSGYAHEPPIPMIQPPLSIGASWTALIQSFAMPAGTPQDPWTGRFDVLTYGDVTVPMGTFSAWGVWGPNVVVAQGPLAGRTLAGEWLGTTAPAPGQLPAGPSPNEWWAPGIGEIQYQSDTLYQLAGYDLPTPAVASSWGRIKSLYR